MTDDATMTEDPPAAPATDAATEPPRRRATKHTPATNVVARASVRVTLTRLDDFEDEMMRDAESIDGRIVRTFERYDPPDSGYGMRRVDQIAGYVVGGQVVEVVQTIGTLWADHGEADEKTLGLISSWREALAAMCEGQGLELRGGRFGPL